MSSAYDTMILAESGLLAYLPGNDAASPAADATGNGHALTLPTGATTGAASLLPLDSEHALSWGNTVAAEGSVAVPASLGSSTTPAVEYWVKYAALTGGNQHDVRASGTGTGWGAGYKAGSGFLFTTFGHADNTFGINATVGAVYHVAFALDAGGHLSLFVNGVLLGTLSGVGITSGATAAGVGGMSTDSDFMQAVIQKIAIYSAPLAPARWAAHFAAGAGGIVTALSFGHKPSLVSGTSGTAQRSSGALVLV